MTAVAVARIFVNDARSKIVSSVIGSARARDPSSPGSPASLREPKARRKTILPACPIMTTAPGNRCAATASSMSWETGVKSNSGATAGAVVARELVPGGGCAACPHEGAAARMSKTVPTAQTRATRDPDSVTRSTVAGASAARHEICRIRGRTESHDAESHDVGPVAPSFEIERDGTLRAEQAEQRHSTRRRDDFPIGHASADQRMRSIGGLADIHSRHRGDHCADAHAPRQLRGLRFNGCLDVVSVQPVVTLIGKATPSVAILAGKHGVDVLSVGAYPGLAAVTICRR